MQDIAVDSRCFHFPDTWLVMKYDDTPFYQNHLKNKKGWKPGLKGVDLAAYNPFDRTLYLIESKDYRAHRRKKKTSPEREFFDKVINTFTGIVPTMLCSISALNGENELRSGIRNAEKLRLIYQFEQPAKHSKLFPRVFNPDEMQRKLRQELKCFDPHVLVIEAATQAKVSWTAD